MSGRRRNSNEGGGAGEEAWLLPYADMITLLLGLFIVLFALSSIDSSKFDNVSKAFSETFKGQVLQNPGSVLSGSNGALNASATTARTRQAVTLAQSAAAQQSQQRFSQEQKQLESMAQQMSGALKDKVQISTDERGIVIRVAGDALFKSGSYEIKEPATAQLKAIAKQLKGFGAQLDIEGHTDGQSFPGQFDNWGLSADRALAVRQLFQEQGVPRGSMHPVAMADTKPVVKPTRPNENIPQNRRVEIHVLAPAANVADHVKFTPETERIAAQTKRPNVLESAQHDQLVKAAAATPSPTPAKPARAPSSNWGGTSTSSDDVIAPIVSASK